MNGAGQFSIGAKVRLRGCAFGEPGTVLRIEQRKLVVLWHDLDYLARHSPESLMLTGELPQAGAPLGRPQADAAGERAVIRPSGIGHQERGRQR